MKRLICAIAAIFVLTALCVSPVLAEEAPDAKVKGLWLKATGLPGGAFLEDWTREDNMPFFFYCFGEGPDGEPAVTISVGRSPQDDDRQMKFLNLDKKALEEYFCSESFEETAKDLTFTEAPEFSKKFTYPCQIATYTDSEMGLRFMNLFMQTDEYMFSAQVMRDVNDKAYSDADAKKWLMGLELVVQ